MNNTATNQGSQGTIEPVTEFYEKCNARHSGNKDVTVLNLARGDEEKEIEISCNTL